jgi:hypothetical protein
LEDRLGVGETSWHMARVVTGERALKLVARGDDAYEDIGADDENAFVSLGREMGFVHGNNGREKHNIKRLEG